MSAPDLRALIRAARANWVLVAELATFILAAILPFLWPPPSQATDQGSAKNIACVIATVVVALFIAAGLRWCSKRHQRPWFIVAILLLACFYSAYLSYDRVVNRFTCYYRNAPVVIGDRYTPQAFHHKTLLGLTSCSELLDEFAGKVEDVWTADSLAHASTVLLAAYVALVGTGAGMIVSAMQVLGLVLGSGIAKKHA